MQRRNFIKGSLLVGSTALTTLCLGTCAAQGQGVKPVQIDPDAISFDGNEIRIDLRKARFLADNSASGKMDISLAQDKILRLIVANDAEVGYRAFENKCTHGGMRLHYRSDFKNQGPLLRCTSFGHSRFDLDGNVMKGPAKSPLKTFPVTQENKVLILHMA